MYRKIIRPILFIVVFAMTTLVGLIDLIFGIANGDLVYILGGPLLIILGICIYLPLIFKNN